MYQYLLFIWVFILGSMIGSFLNVLIYRIPREEDFVWKRSHCPNCKQMIPFYHNIPIWSFLWLRGKCAHCKTHISWRYPTVELIMGIYMVSTFHIPSHFSELGQWVLLSAIFAILLTHFFIDMEHHLLPNKLNIALLLVVSLYAAFYLHWKSSLWGAGLGFFFPYLIGEAFYRLRGIEGLGGGDIKLWGVLGVMLGPLGIIQNIFYSSLLGSVIGGLLIFMTKKGKNHAFAFGPFIILSYLIQFHLGEYIPSFFKLF